MHARAQVAGRQTAMTQVPAPFLDSFLHRNPVNQALQAAAARA
jgi:hypothetical protein